MNLEKKYSNLTFIDTETTGMNPLRDRIVEIAIIRVENGRIVKTLNTLLNPNINIPSFIKNITGINNEMLENKPTFYDIAGEVKALFNDSIFVSHNSHFDYGFIKEEFKRLDINFRVKHLCTVRLYKKLYPNVKSHSLDSLINYFGFACTNRHRAYDDCKVLVDFYSKITSDHSAHFILTTIHKIVNKQSMPPKIVISDVAALPKLPGVYIFYSKDGIPIYVGKSINIKERVYSHFNNIANVTDLRIVKEIYKIKYVETAGEFGALITENKLIKELSPIYNKRLRKVKKLVCVLANEKSNDYSSVSIVDFSSVDIDSLNQIIEIFKTKKQAKEFILQKCNQFSLCTKIMGLDNSKSQCFNYSIGKCKGACIGKESFLQHNIKFIMAFATNKYKQWPYKGNKIIKEQNANGLVEYHVINNWKYLGVVENENELPKDSNEGVFDLDEYKIIKRFLAL